MRATVAKWGNSLALRLPKRLAADARIVEGTAVDLRVEAGCLVVSPARPQYRLDDLLADTRPETSHEESDWGAPRGKEVW